MEGFKRKVNDLVDRLEAFGQTSLDSIDPMEHLKILEEFNSARLTTRDSERKLLRFCAMKDSGSNTVNPEAYLQSGEIGDRTRGFMYFKGFDNPRDFLEELYRN